jgi:hypothetical protein
MKSIINIYIGIALAVVIISSCKPKAPSTYNSAIPLYANSVVVVEEGPFANGSGDFSIINRANGVVSRNVYSNVQGEYLGSIAQHMNIASNGKVYLTVNNSNKMVVFDNYNFATKQTVNGLKLPRYTSLVKSDKLYISEWGTNGTQAAIKVYNTNTRTITKSIPLGNGAEEIVSYGNVAYVALNGGYLNNDSVAVINIDNDSLMGKIYIGPNPTNMVMDKDNNIWIMCKGKWNSNFTALAEQPKLVKYNTFTNKVEKQFTLNTLYSQPYALKINNAKDKLYYSWDGGLWYLPITESVLQTVPFIYGNYYGLGVDPKNDDIYAADAKDFASNGIVRRFYSWGGIRDSFNVGLIPNGFAFVP